MSIRQAAAVGVAVVGIVAAGTGTAMASAGAGAVAANSGGVASGNNIQIPVHVPVTVCGNSVSVVGLMNPVVGSSCSNTG
ncbi:chaplin [Kitasatospora sp. GP82]|uniref:chaplin n=1 Tax=Kitasatospora sp. GP82 TaxID=3035089 RepID=UPI0024739624|nr:chaplin [Kitasatospora sp. GP82]MDH6124398.1 hypothetical protein [Kitasatospora sp. GP82]